MVENENVLTEEEAKFCLLYVNAPAPYGGNEIKCFQAVFKDKFYSDVEASISVRELMRKESIRQRIVDLQENNTVNATTLRPRLTQTLLKVADECSESKYSDRFGNELSPAALRSVAVNAIRLLSDMYGIKEDIAHKVSIEGGNGSGVTINVIAPQKTDNTEMIEELMGG